MAFIVIAFLRATQPPSNLSKWPDIRHTDAHPTVRDAFSSRFRNIDLQHFKLNHLFRTQILQYHKHLDSTRNNRPFVYIVYAILTLSRFGITRRVNIFKK